MTTERLMWIQIAIDMDADCERHDPVAARRRSPDAFLAGAERSAFRMAVFAVGNRDDALDIIQDAMLRLVRRYAQRPEAARRPLFFMILRNAIVDHQRRRGVRGPVEV